MTSISMKICIKKVVDTKRETHNPKHRKLRSVSESVRGSTCSVGNFVSSEGCDTSWMSSIVQSNRGSTSSDNGSSNSEGSDPMMMTRTVDLL